MAGRKGSINVIGLIVKLLVLIILLMGGLFLYLTCSGSSCLVQRIDKIAPDAIKAPWEIHTHTHTYYAENALRNDNGDVVMKGWYELAEEKWIYHKGSETLEKKVYGTITSKRR